MARWYRSGRYYGRNRRNYYYNNNRYKNNMKNRAWGNMKAAKQQADQAQVTINIPSSISAFCSNYTHQGKTVTAGCYALSIFDQLRKSDFFQNYANMYDEFKIDRVKVKLLPTRWSNLSSNNNYRNLTVYTAWDRSGLNESQYELLVGKDYRNDTTHWPGHNIWVIGSASGTPESDDPNAVTDYGGLYVTVGKDISTYSSAESRVVNINTNTSITRWLNPKTQQEKGQWLSTGSLKNWYISYDMARGRYYDIPVTDFKELRVEEDWSAEQIVTSQGLGENTITKSSISGLSSDNPCSLLEDNGIRFKPILLVSVYPEDNNTVKWQDPTTQTNIDVPANLMSFNTETEVVVSFRGLRKSKVVAA